jgi:hypothetical protein
MRTARSWTSGENFGDFLMLAPFSIEGASSKTGAVQRRSFDLLVMKVLALLQDTDPPLAGALASSRESIWSVLSDPAKLDKF